jgi:hypothetical protein
VLWKSNKKVLQCQSNLREQRRSISREKREVRKRSLGDSASEKFAERLAECEDFSESSVEKSGRNSYDAAFPADFITPTARSSQRRGALMIVWMSSAPSTTSFTPS